MYNDGNKAEVFVDSMEDQFRLNQQLNSAKD